VVINILILWLSHDVVSTAEVYSVEWHGNMILNGN